MGVMGLKSLASPLFTQPCVQAQIKENIKAPRHWPLSAVKSPHKGPLTRKMLPLDDVIMMLSISHALWLPHKAPFCSKLADHARHHLAKTPWIGQDTAVLEMDFVYFSHVFDQCVVMVGQIITKCSNCVQEYPPKIPRSYRHHIRM